MTVNITRVVRPVLHQRTQSSGFKAVLHGWALLRINRPIVLAMRLICPRGQISRVEPPTTLLLQFPPLSPDIIIRSTLSSSNRSPPMPPTPTFTMTFHFLLTPLDTDNDAIALLYS